MQQPLDDAQQATRQPRGLSSLSSILSTAPHHLAAISLEQAAAKPAPDKWSIKEELGHLIDSAANNHQRIVRAQLEDSPAMPSYDGDRWVELHAYQRRDWNELIRIWHAANEQLLCAAQAVPADGWSRTCTIGDSEPLTIRFVLDDYVDHMVSHLSHIGLDADRLLAPPASDDKALYPEKPAHNNYPINELMARRWSPRVFEEGRAVEREKILTLLEAVRWAPSCFNEQPWRYLVFDGSDKQAMARAQACLVEGNAWALKSPVLMISVAREAFTYNGAPNRTAQHDVGLASENLALQAVELGLIAHQMAGFDTRRARQEFNIPEGFTPLAMITVGYAYRGDLDALPEKVEARELAPRERKPLGEIAFAGDWGVPYAEQ